MKENKFIDTNVFLRYFTADSPTKSPKVKTLIQKLYEGSVEAETSDLVFAELVWVMESFYNVHPAEIAKKLSFILNLKGLKLPNKSLLLDAISSYVEKNVDFVDAYNAALMKHRSISFIYSYDKDFDNLAVKRIES